MGGIGAAGGACGMGDMPEFIGGMPGGIGGAPGARFCCSGVGEFGGVKPLPYGFVGCGEYIDPPGPGLKCWYPTFVPTLPLPYGGNW